jgi:hypothetical protein
MSRMLGRRRAHAQLNSEMPLRQYFLFVGGSLLTLLFAANWLMPTPASNERVNSEPKLPAIRIHSQLRGPDAVVIEASNSTIGVAAPQVVVAPQTVTAVESAQNRAFAQPAGPNGNEQHKEESQQLTGRRAVAARLVRRPTLTHRPAPAHVEPVLTRAVDSRLEFRETFAQLSPTLIETTRGGETAYPDISGIEGGVKTRSLPNMLGCNHRRRSPPCMRTSPSLFND